MIIMRCKLRSRSIVLSAFILGSLLGFQRVNAAPSSQEINQIQFDVGERSEDAMLKYLVPALVKAGKAGRIYYEASCPPGELIPNIHYTFPTINLHPPSKDVSGLAAVREIFQDNPNIEVEERPSGIIRIKIGKVFNTILQTNISLIAVPPEGVYDSHSAITAIEMSKEVRAATSKLDLRLNNGMFDGGITPPGEGRPHLSSPMTNLTMDEALDIVAQTFKEIIVYGACPNQHYYTLSETGGPNSDYMSDSPP